MESKGEMTVAEALIVLTGTNVWTMKDGSPHPTGFWAREFIEAHDAFTDGGLGVSIATPLGVKPTVDQLSWYPPYNNNDDQFIAQQKKWLEARATELDAPLRLEDVEPGRYDVVYVVGGHGPMQDLAVHPTIGDLLVANLDDPDKYVGGVCHGPASFLSAHRADGTWAFTGRKLTSFTNEEKRRRPSPAMRHGCSRTACVWPELCSRPPSRGACTPWRTAISSPVSRTTPPEQRPARLSRSSRHLGNSTPRCDDAPAPRCRGSAVPIISGWSAGGALLDEGGDRGRLRQEDRMAGRYFRHPGARPLRHRALRRRRDHPVFGGDHVPAWPGLPNAET